MTVAIDELLAEERNHVGVELLVEGNAILEALARGADMHAESGSNCEKSEN
jgi:hypothetical protein